MTTNVESIKQNVELQTDNDGSLEVYDARKPIPLEKEYFYFSYGAKIIPQLTKSISCKKQGVTCIMSGTSDSFIQQDYDADLKTRVLVVGSKEPSFPVLINYDSKKMLFRELKNQWEKETLYEASIERIVLHQAYQKIVGLGNTAIPFILNELKERPGHWFWALKSISREDPVLPKHRGNIKKMTNDWLIWGKKKHYIEHL